MATMMDVAKRAGVSIATVSFLVNGTKRVAPETRTRIEAAMAELGFRRNVVARGLASGRTRILALLFPSLSHRLGGAALEFVTSAVATASERGYSLVLWPVGSDADQIGELLAGGLVDGVVLMEIRLDDPRVDRLVEAKVPFSLIGRTRDTTGLPFVDIDFESTVRDGLDYLTGLGHRKIALILESREGQAALGYGPVARAEASYRDYLATRGLEPVVLSAEESPRGGRQAAVELLEAEPETTAIMVMNEVAAFGIVSGLTHAGLRVPQDISLLSIATTLEMGAMSDPILTTMNAPGIELARLGVNDLIDRLEAPSTEITQVLIPCALQLGESTATRQR